MMPINHHGVAKTLPAMAAERLAAAGIIEDAAKRRRAVDTAIDFAKTNYPEFFKEQDHETASQ